MNALDPHQARRRYVALTALRWLPPGMTIAVSALLMVHRGLDVVQIGALHALQSVVVAALELPTGGLADSWGRRRVLLLSGALNLTATAAMAFAYDGWGFAGAYLLLAVGRALGSGPLEAWYVDTVHAQRPDADLTRGLAAGRTAECLALGVGALSGGLVPLTLGPLLDQPLASTVLAAAALAAVSLLAHALLVVEPAGQQGPEQPRPTLLATVAGGLRTASRDRTVARVLLATSSIGIAVSALEAMGPVRFAELHGSAERASTVYGTLTASAFALSAAGAALGPFLVRTVRPGWLVLVSTTVLAGVAVTALAAPLLGLAVAGFTLPYLLLAVPSGPAAAALHRRVTASERATVLSVQSLVLQGSAAVSSIVLPVLTAQAGTTVGWLVTGGLVAGTAACWWGLENG